MSPRADEHIVFSMSETAKPCHLLLLRADLRTVQTNEEREAPLHFRRLNEGSGE